MVFPGNAVLVGPETPFIKSYFELQNNQFEYEIGPDDEKYLSVIKKALNKENSRVKKKEQAQKLHKLRPRLKLEQRKKQRGALKRRQRQRPKPKQGQKPKLKREQKLLKKKRYEQRNSRLLKQNTINC